MKLSAFLRALKALPRLLPDPSDFSGESYTVSEQDLSRAGLSGAGMPKALTFQKKLAPVEGTKYFEFRWYLQPPREIELDLSSLDGLLNLEGLEPSDLDVELGGRTPQKRIEPPWMKAVRETKQRADAIKGQ